MRKRKIYFRFLLVLIPMFPALALGVVPGFQFSIMLCFLASALILLFCVLSLWKGKASRIIRRILTVILVLGLLIAAGTEIMIVKNSQSDEEDTPYIILLGAGVNGTTPSLMLQNRIDAAYAYLTAHPDTVCIVSGGQGPGEEISEAECMFRELTKMGITPDRIWQETEATSTVENIRFSLELIENRTGSRPQTAGIVSNEFHLCRAKRMAQDQDLNALGIPAKTSWLSLRINYYLREIAGYWYYILFGGY